MLLHIPFCRQDSRLTSNALPQPAYLLTAEATQLAWRASVDNILAATVKYAGVVMYCAAPVYAEAPSEEKSSSNIYPYTQPTRNSPTPSSTWLKATKDLTSLYGLSEINK